MALPHRMSTVVVLMLAVVAMLMEVGGSRQPRQGRRTKRGNDMCSSNSVAEYKLTFYGAWSKEKFPRMYPTSRPHAQWSKLVGEFYSFIFFFLLSIPFLLSIFPQSSFCVFLLSFFLFLSTCLCEIFLLLLHVFSRCLLTCGIFSKVSVCLNRCLYMYVFVCTCGCTRLYINVYVCAFVGVYFVIALIYITIINHD